MGRCAQWSSIYVAKSIKQLFKNISSFAYNLNMIIILYIPKISALKAPSQICLLVIHLYIVCERFVSYDVYFKHF